MTKKAGNKVVRLVRSRADELAMLAAQGRLHPRDVVQFARDPKTKLHSAFEWDDTKAAAKWRLEQARDVVRAFVITISASHGPVNIRALHSLPGDRQAGGGYRRIQDVLKNEQLVEELVEGALKELASVKARYEMLAQLSPVWNAAEAVKMRHGKRPAAKKAA